MSDESEPIKTEMKIQVSKSPDFRSIIVDSLYGNLDSIGLRAIVYSEHVGIEKALHKEEIDQNEIMLERTIECELVIKPQQLKAIHLWLGGKIADYEAMYGRISSPEEVNQRAEKHFGEKEKRNKDLQ